MDFGDEEWDYGSQQSQAATSSSSPNVKYQHYEIEDREGAQAGYSSGISTTYGLHPGSNNTEYWQSHTYSSGTDNSAARSDRTSPASYDIETQNALTSFQGMSIDNSAMLYYDQDANNTFSNEYATQNDSRPAWQSYPVFTHDSKEFGKACDDLGLLKRDRDYWQAPDKYSTPASYWNEERLKNNCVFVTLGVLLRQTARELSESINVPVPPEQETGITFGTMERILNTLAIETRRGIHLVIFSPVWTWGIKPDEQQSLAMNVLSPFVRKYKSKEFGLVYRRKSGSGHCIVVQIEKETRVLKLKNCAFTCFQYQTEGTDKFEDVKESYFWAAIFLKSRSSPKGLEITHQDAHR